MGRPKKDCTPVSFRMDNAVYRQLNQFCKETGQPKTVAVERILSKYFDKYFSNPEQDRHPN